MELGGFYTFREDPADLAELRTWQGVIVFWPRITFARSGNSISGTASGSSSVGFVSGISEHHRLQSARFRYRLASFIPLNRPTIEEKAFYSATDGRVVLGRGW